MSYSVINQRALTLRYTEQVETGEEEEYAIVDFYIDDGLTGTDDSCEESRRMLWGIERKGTNCIIVKDLSRPFRNYTDRGRYLEYFFRYTMPISSHCGFRFLTTICIRKRCRAPPPRRRAL